MAEDGIGGVKSARRVLELLEHLAERPDGATFPQLLEDLSLPKSSLYGLLTTLVDQGWAYLHEPTRRYRIGLRLWHAAQGFSQFDALAQIAQKHLEAVRDELNETVQLAVLEGTDNVYITKVESDHPLRLVSHVGARLPAYATGLGKVLLASLEPDEFRHRMSTVTMQPFTHNTVTSVEELDRQLATIRARGYGEDEGEYTVGVYCLAVPTFGANGETIAAMSCSVPNVRFGGTEQERAKLLSSLTRHAKALSEEFAAPSAHRR
ncbi:MAG: hypothetical protein BGO26_13740 [Actinobacteria bacterium 69-20]|nr:IclR family transcriptional regulator [Actinomycetota bacterium]OJV27643.1 MAG: hypothetical protein BGO26_13740 [Actinobacteria bacterium 69-20]